VIRRAAGFPNLGLAVAALIIALASACSDDDGDAVPALGGAESEVCGSMERLDESVEKAEDLNTGSSVAEARQVFEEVRTAFNAFVDSVRNVAGVRIDELQTAAFDFRAAIAELSASQSLGQAAGTIQDEVDRLNEAVQSTKSELRCP
jgi:predicted trehalose synthase